MYCIHCTLYYWFVKLLKTSFLFLYGLDFGVLVAEGYAAATGSLPPSKKCWKTTLKQYQAPVVRFVYALHSCIITVVSLSFDVAMHGLILYTTALKKHYMFSEGFASTFWYYRFYPQLLKSVLLFVYFVYSFSGTYCLRHNNYYKYN